MQHLRRSAAACLIVLVILAVGTSPASAHTGFESSEPADGAVLDGPAAVVTIVFTGDAEPTGAGFEILEPGGLVRQPSEASSADGRTWILRFDPPLSGGVVGVRWMVKAPDAHPIDGSFSFTTPAVIPPPSEEAEQAVEPEGPAEGDVSDGNEDAVVATPGAERSAVEDPAVEDPVVELEEFLATGSESGRSAGRVGTFGRFVALMGTLIGVGGLVFAATAMRGRRSEVRHVLFWVRRAGVIVAVGALIEFVAQVVIEDAGSWTAVWSPSAVGGVAWSTFGIAAALRLFGGLALSAGLRLDTISGFRVEDHAWRASSDSAGAVLGALAVIAAYLFDGHTVTKGNRLLAGVVDIVHVGGAAIWAGGVIMLASVLWRRHREGSDLRALQLATRFSVVASVALVVVGAAGVFLTIIVLDTPSELWSTEWGRTLIAKVAFVGIAALVGAYNHRVLIPQMDAAPPATELADKFRAVVTGEALAFVAVAVATAFLMGAAS